MTEIDLQAGARCSLARRTGPQSALQRGTAVHSADGANVGIVEGVLDNYGEHIFDGVVFGGLDGELRFTNQYVVDRSSDRGVTVVLSINAGEASSLPSPEVAFRRIGDSGTRLAERFVDAIAAKDFDRVKELLHPKVDFLAVTPGQSWHATNADDVTANVLPGWFWAEDQIDELVSVETGSIADRIRLGYRLRGHNPIDGVFLVEQQAYLGERDGRIGWMRVTCSGFRPIGRAGVDPS